MDKYLWIIFTLAIIITFIFTPKFLKAQRPGISKRSLTFKMICASMFVIVGLLSMKLGANTSFFAILMTWGLFFSWFGDFSLHAGNKKIYFIAGLLFFMTAHIMYTLAYRNAWKFFFKDKPFLTVTEIVIIAVLFTLFMLYYIKAKINLKNVLFIPVFIYAIVLLTMFVKALVFSINYMSATGENITNNIPTAILLSVGAFFFLCSDASLGVLLFNPKHKKNYPLKCFNIWTYFVGQLMLASTILFIKTDLISF